MLFRERLSVPVLWWVLAVGLALSLLLAVGLYLGPAWGIGAAAAAWPLRPGCSSALRSSSWWTPRPSGSAGR